MPRNALKQRNTVIILFVKWTFRLKSVRTILLLKKDLDQVFRISIMRIHRQGQRQRSQSLKEYGS